VIGSGVQSGSAPDDVAPRHGIVGTTTDTFILFENGVRRNRLVLPGLSNAADHMPSKLPTAPVPVGNLIWLAVDCPIYLLFLEQGREPPHGHDGPQRSRACLGANRDRDMVTTRLSDKRTANPKAYFPPRRAWPSQRRAGKGDRRYRG
jgi:hypothetical protein